MKDGVDYGLDILFTQLYDVVMPIERRYGAGVYSIWICWILINSLQLNSANVSL